MVMSLAENLGGSLLAKRIPNARPRARCRVPGHAGAATRGDLVEPGEPEETSARRVTVCGLDYNVSSAQLEDLTFCPWFHRRVCDAQT